MVIGATGLTLSPSSETIDIGETVQLEGTLTPSNATTNSLTWESSDSSIASVDSNGLVTGVSTGEVTITATTVNGMEATCTIIVESIDTSVANVPTVNTNGLIPVVYINSNWVVADTSKQWYNYSNQEWANAVVLKSGVTKSVGATVNIEREVQ